MPNDHDSLWARLCHAERLVGYASTVHRENTDEWMRGFVEHINEYCRLYHNDTWQYDGERLVRRKEK